MNVVITQSWQQLHAGIDLLYPVVDRYSGGLFGCKASECAGSDMMPVALGLRYYRTSEEVLDDKRRNLSA